MYSIFLLKVLFQNNTSSALRVFRSFFCFTQGKAIHRLGRREILSCLQQTEPLSLKLFLRYIHCLLAEVQQGLGGRTLSHAAKEGFVRKDWFYHSCYFTNVKILVAISFMWQNDSWVEHGPTSACVSGRVHSADLLLLLLMLRKLNGLIFISTKGMENSWPFQWYQLIPWLCLDSPYLPLRFALWQFLYHQAPL